MALAKEAELTLNEPSNSMKRPAKVLMPKSSDEVLVGREVWLKENEIGGMMIRQWIWMRLKGIVWFIAKNGKFMGWIGMTDEIRRKWCTGRAQVGGRSSLGNCLR